MRVTEGKQAFQAQLHALRLAYVTQLPGKMEEIHRHWLLLRDAPWSYDELGRVRRLVHGITGSGATFGFDELSRKARAVEDDLSALLESKEPPDESQRARLDERMSALQAVAAEQEAPAPAKVDPTTPVAPAAAAPTTRPTPDAALIYVLEDDPLQARNLAQQVAHFAYDVEVFESSTELLQAARRRRPAVVVLDIMLPDGDLGGIETAARLRDVAPGRLPIVFMSSRSDVEARLSAVRVGGRAYLHKPVEPGRVIDELDRITQRRAPEPHRVLLVEDDDHEALLYSSALRDVGFVVQRAAGTREIMAGLVEFRPDIILMDFYLSDCTGLELAAMIRQQEAYVGIPIIFVSAERDSERQLEAVQAGADAFLTKPVRLDHLVASVRARAERSRHLGSFLVRDSLTGALNHTALKAQLTSELARARRVEKGLAYAMIDIDHFKQVNDRFGHSTGDRVLKSLAHLLARRLRTSDTIGRYGGEEFGLILPAADARQAWQVVDEIRARFERVRHQSGASELAVTFSGGIATYPTHTTAKSISEAADAALYAAKAEGRNRIVLDER